MDLETLKKLLEAVNDIAVTAGRAILAVAVDSLQVSNKEDGSPLTKADLASHKVIESALANLPPKFPILSEEGDLEQVQKDRWRTFWCVDPLDGTKEFVKGLDEYTVNIALVEDGAAILGAIYVPVQDVLYYAARGAGAFKCSGRNAKPQRIRASQCERPKRAVVSRSHLSQQTEEFLERLDVTEMVRHGSSIKICTVAEGAADIYPRHGPTCLWDTAAGAAIAVEAGCKVVGLDGKPLSYNPADGLKREGFIVYPASCSIAIEL